MTCSGAKLQSQGESAGQDLGHTQVLATRERVPNVWASCGGRDHTGWGSFLSKNHAWSLPVSRESPLLRSGVHWEAVCSCWPPSMPCLYPHFGGPWWARQDPPSSSRCPHRSGLKVLDPLTCLITVKWSWAPGGQLAPPDTGVSPGHQWEQEGSVQSVC